MSKRKGRKPARSSEVKSVLRAPPEGENELESERPGAVDPDSDTLPLDVLSEVVEAEDQPVSEPPAADSEPSAPAESAAAPRQRRLRAVRAAEAETLPEGNAEGAGSGAADERAPDDDARHSEVDADSAGDGVDLSDEVSEPGDDERFVPFPLEAEGDDTEGFLRGLIEALLFTSQKPLELKDLARSAGIDKPRAKELLDQLMGSYDGRGLCVEQVAGGFVMRSSPRYAPYIQKILALKPVRLSRAQLETLAIVAYRQPVTKPEVDDIRGVDSGQVIKGLLERSLLKMLGKKDEPGRPTLYGTTNDFLELLNLQSLKDLPTLREYTELSEESQRKFLDETGETPPSGAISFERPPQAQDEGASGGEQPVAAEGELGTEPAIEPSESAPEGEVAEGEVADALTADAETDHAWPDELDGDEPRAASAAASDHDEVTEPTEGAPTAAADDDDADESDDDADEDEDDADEDEDDADEDEDEAK